MYVCFLVLFCFRQSFSRILCVGFVLPTIVITSLREEGASRVAGGLHCSFVHVLWFTTLPFDDRRGLQSLIVSLPGNICIVLPT